MTCPGSENETSCAGHNLGYRCGCGCGVGVVGSHRAVDAAVLDAGQVVVVVVLAQSLGSVDDRRNGPVVGQQLLQQLL